MELIIVAGMPAAGKSTVAAGLAEYFHYPILEKDNIKEVLFDTVGFGNYPQKRRLDIAANGVLLHVLELMLKADSSVIVVNNFDTESAGQLCDLMETYQPRSVTVFLNGDAQVLYQRYVERDNLHKRHLGHILQEHYPPHDGDSLDYTMTREEFDEKFFKRGMDQFRCPGERIDLDMTDFDAVCVEDVARQIRALLDAQEA
ncbi:MAG: ATP-binding protein [Ruminococcaceae bacterium]|nr:ATP-binding protein [Oscillospiraceae bacterium]